MSRASESLIPTRALSASPESVPATYAVHHSGWIPVIHHPGRIEWLAYELFRRKVKPSAAEAIEHARRVIWYRQKRATEKRRRIESLSHPHWHFALAAE
jgi:hypothetical protein